MVYRKIKIISLRKFSIKRVYLRIADFFLIGLEYGNDDRGVSKSLMSELRYLHKFH